MATLVDEAAARSSRTTHDGLYSGGYLAGEGPLLDVEDPSTGLVFAQVRTASPQHV